MNRRKSKQKEKLNIAMFGQKRIPSREGGVEIVVEELCSRMVAQGHNVTCYNRGGHHVSGSEYDSKRLKEYKGIRLKTVPTIEKKGLAAVSSSFFAALCCAFGRYDIVHIHAEGPTFFAWLPKLFGKKVIVTIHGLDWQREKWKSGFGSKFIHQGEKNAVKYADEIIVLSKGVQDYFEKVYILECSDKKSRARNYAIVKAVAILGTLLVPLLRATLMQNVSERWHVVYLVPAIIGFVMSLFALLFARETNAFLTKRIEYLKTPIEEREQRSKEGREQNAQGGILTAVKFAFRHRQLRFLIIACCCFYLASLGTATYSTVMAKSALMTEEEITLALFLYPVGNALFTLISGFVSDKFGRKVTIVAMSCSALTCYLLFIFSGMFKWTPYLTGFAIGGFMGSYWGAGDTIGGIMFSESTPTNLRSSVTVINTLLNGVMGGLATVITMILLPIIPERMFGYMYLGLTVPGLVGAIVIMWLFVGETRGLDLKTVTGTEWDKPKKVKEEQQDGE